MKRALSFRARLFLVVLPSLLVVAALAYAAVAPRLAQANLAKRASVDGKQAEASMLFFDELQVESTFTGRYLRTKGATAKADLILQRVKTDTARQNFVTLVLPRSQQRDDGVNGLTGVAISATFDLDQHRSQIDGFTISADESFATFNRFERATVVLSGALTSGDGDEGLAKFGNLISTFLEFKEAKGELYSYPASRVDGAKWSDAELTTFLGLEDNAQRAVRLFSATADVASRRTLNTLTNGADYRANDALATTLLDAANKKAATSVTSDDWVISANKALASINSIDDENFRLFSIQADNLAITGRNSAIVYGTIGLLGFLAAAISALLVGRNLTRRLKRVTSDAHTIAVDRLPEVLETLRHPTPEALAGALPQIASDKNDEIGQLANDFNQILRTSIETSLEHSQRQAATMTNLLVNLGRRNQSLIDRQLDLIDQLESSEQNPDLLESLFKLDHMVTRQRRNAESLLILAGSKRSRSWSAPVALSDVIRGAISEVADLNRVRFEVQPGNDLLLSGQYAVDLSHLLAELIENATLFSNPTTAVTVRVQRGPLHFRVWVIDSGVGMSEEELVSANVIVSDPPLIEELATDRVGFQVVGRLAQRFGVRVRVQNNPSGGVAASVDLPAALFDSLNQDVPVVAEAESAVRAASRSGEPPVIARPEETAALEHSDNDFPAELLPSDAKPAGSAAAVPVVTASSVLRQSRAGAPAPAMKFDASIVPPSVRSAQQSKSANPGELPRRNSSTNDLPGNIVPRPAPKRPDDGASAVPDVTALPRRGDATPAPLPRRGSPTAGPAAAAPESLPRRESPADAESVTAAGLPRRGALNGTFGAAGAEVARRLPDSTGGAGAGNDAERRARMMTSFTQGVDAGRDDDQHNNGDKS
jgi:HAMP domain-containing protein/two-component sensor histidine kinase